MPYSVHFTFTNTSAVLGMTIIHLDYILLVLWSSL